MVGIGKSIVLGLAVVFLKGRLQLLLVGIVLVKVLFRGRERRLCVIGLGMMSGLG